MRSASEEAEPFVDHVTTAQLSLAIQSVHSRTSNDKAATSLWAIIPVSSKSEMEIVLRRLSEVISALATWGLKRRRNSIGDVVRPSGVASQTPPFQSNRRRRRRHVRVL